MRRPLAGWWVGVLVAAGALVSGPGLLRAADESALAGNWKVIVLSGGQELTVWLIRIETKDGKDAAEILSTSFPRFKDSKVTKFRADDKSVHLVFAASGTTFDVSAHVPRGEKKPKKLLGSVSFGGQREFALMERTDVKKLPEDVQKNVVKSPAIDAFNKANRAEDADKDKAFVEIVKKYPSDPIAYYAAMQRLNLLTAKEAKDTPLRTRAEEAVKMASHYGPEMKAQAQMQVAQALLRSDKGAAVAADFARQAEKALPASAPAAQRQGVMKVLASALRKAGKDDEVKKVEQQIAELDEVLDKEYLKTAVPFKPKPYPGRKGKNERVVVVELFTGAQCPPCVAADVAFDALLKRYKPDEVVLLQYHLHIPGPDALTNKASEDRAKFYNVEYTPFLLVDGKQLENVGGPKAFGKQMYEKVHKAVDKQLEEKADGRIKLTAKRDGDDVKLSADVSGLKNAGEDLRLRFVLVEDNARYVGRNGQRFHHHVVRALPGGAKGFALKEKSDKPTATVNLKELHKSLGDYLAKMRFGPDQRPVGLKHLKAVALIQNDKTKEIVQAAQVDVPAAK